MERICPVCSTQLNNSCVYFCIYCGTRLPEHLVLDNTIFVPQILRPFGENKQLKSILDYFDREKLKSLLLLFLLVVFVFLGIWALNVGSSYMQDYEKRITAPVDSGDRTYSNVVDFGFSVDSIVFDTFLLSAVPYESQVLFVGSDQTFLQEFLDLSEATKISLSQHFDKTVVAFVIPEDNSLSVGILLKKNSDFVNLDIPNWTLAELSDGIVIFTNNEKLIEKSTDSLSRISRSILQNSDYSSAKPLLKPHGQLMVINFTKDFELLYRLTREFNLSAKLSEHLDNISFFKYDKFVVDKNASN